MTALRFPLRLTLYLGEAFFLRVLVVLGVLLALTQAVDLVGESNRILAAPGAGEGQLWRYVALRLPVLASQFAPFAVLLAAVATFAPLASTSQVIAMRAAGMSSHQLLAPMVAVGALCAVLHFCLNEVLAIQAAARLADWKATDYGAVAAAPPAPAEVWVTAGATVINAQRVVDGPNGIALEDIAVFTHDAEGKLLTIATAARGVLTARGGVLSDVETLDVASNAKRHMPSLPWDPALPPETFLAPEIDPARLEAFALARIINTMHAGSHDARRLTAELYQRFTRPLGCILMPLLACSVAFSLARRGGMIIGIASVLVLGFLYFVADGVIGALGDALALSPFLAASLPLAIFALIAETILLRVEV